MRLIDADIMRNEWLENGENEYVYDTNAVLDSIDQQPTIDIRHWIPVTERLPEPPDKNYSDGGVITEVLSLYCPNCGAKMDAEG